MTGDAARRLGEDLARLSAAPGGAGTVTGQVLDVTDAGVNLLLGGSLIPDVPCLPAYRNRRAGDWVVVRPGSRPLVLGRPESDPDDEATIRSLAKEVLLDEQVIRAATWGIAVPSGTGWQQVQTLFLRKDKNGQVELYGQLASQSDTSPTAPADRAPRPVTISPTASGTWRGGRPDDYASYPTQGDWTGRGNRRGAWFYGSRIMDACQGKTVSRMTVTFTRRRGSGANSRRPLHLYLHDHHSPPGGQLDLDEGPEELLRLSVGARGTATLPASWRDKLADGTRKGLAIYATGRTDYMAVSGGTIRIEFS